MIIFYTCVTNDYDKIVIPYKDPDVRYVCFYDSGVEPEAEGWEYIPLTVEGTCPVRRSYHPKHRPDLYFDAGDTTVWVDASYQITEALVNESKIILEDNDFALQEHPSKRTLLAEFAKLYEQGFSTEEEIIDMAKKIRSIGYSLDEYNQTINSVIWRVLTPEVISWCKIWRQWYDLGVNRDQVSSAIAEYVMSTRYRTPMRFKPARIKIKVEMERTNRIKKYWQSYELHDKPSLEKQIELLNNLAEIFDTSADKFVLNKMYACVRYPPFELNPIVQPKDMVVYTCITNGYDKFPKNNYYSPDVRYVCFHDGTIDTTIGPWEYVKLDLPKLRHDVDINCPRRLSFYPKANPHLYFPPGTNTIWVDACYQLTRKFIENSKKCFPFTMLRHASKFSYFDEMLEGFTCAFFSYEDGIELTKELKEANYNFRTYGSPLGTIVWRTMTSKMREFNKQWYDWSLVGCNRDQIAFDAALKFSKIRLPSVYENRGDAGIPLGYYNKKGRLGMHPQRGDLKQYLRKEEFLEELGDITGMSPKLYTEYPDHEFYMKVYKII